MKSVFTSLYFCFFFSGAFAQDTYPVKIDTGIVMPAHHANILTFTVGVSDWQKRNYKLPDNTAFGSSTGFAPLSLRLEHFFAYSISASINLTYDWFYYSYSKKGYTNGVLFYTPQTDRVRFLSPGVIRKKPWLKNRITRCFFGPIKSPP